MSEQTKLPWRNPSYTRRDGHNACWVMDGGNPPKAVCRCFGPHAAKRAKVIIRAVNLFDPFIKLLYHLHNKLQHNKEYADDTRQIENLLHESGHETMPEV